MSGTTLDYTIENKKKIRLEEGTLDTISQKNSIGFHISVVDKVEINLKLRNPAIVLFAEVASIFLPKIIFELYDV